MCVKRRQLGSRLESDRATKSVEFKEVDSVVLLEDNILCCGMVSHTELLRGQRAKHAIQ